MIASLPSLNGKRKAGLQRRWKRLREAKVPVPPACRPMRKHLVIASLLRLNDRRKAALERRLKRLGETRVPLCPQPAGLESLELRGFLAAHRLEDQCYGTHICATYDGSDAPAREEGRLKCIRAWLQQLAVLELFQDTGSNACIQLRKSGAPGSNKSCAARSLGALQPSAILAIFEDSKPNGCLRPKRSCVGNERTGEN